MTACVFCGQISRHEINFFYLSRVSSLMVPLMPVFMTLILFLYGFNATMEANLSWRSVDYARYILTGTVFGRY